MRLFVGLWATLALYCNAEAIAQTDYQWIGRHVCVVEGASGYQVPKGPVVEGLFTWSNAPNSVLVDVASCYAEPMPTGCEERRGRALLTEELPRRDAIPFLWKWQQFSSMPFVNDAGASFSLQGDGRFLYVKPSETSEKNPAVFIAHGVCDPVE